MFLTSLFGWLAAVARGWHSFAEDPRGTAVCGLQRRARVGGAGSSADGNASSVDYLQPGGIYRDVTLRVVPGIYIRDVWAEPVNVLAADRQLQIQVTIDAAAVPSGAFDVTVQLLEATREIAATAGTAPVQAVGDNVVNLTMTGLGGVTLWSPGTPRIPRATGCPWWRTTPRSRPTGPTPPG